MLDWVSGQRHFPVALSPGKGPGTHCTGGYLVPTAGPELFGKLCLRRDWIPGSPSPSRVAAPNMLSRASIIYVGTYIFLTRTLLHVCFIICVRYGIQPKKSVHQVAEHFSLL